MAGGGQIQHIAIVRAAVHQIHDLHQGHQFVDARGRQGEQALHDLAIERGVERAAEKGVKDVLNLLAILLVQLGQQGGGIHFQRIQPGAPAMGVIWSPMAGPGYR
jgi:hypothetical protein